MWTKLTAFLRDFRTLACALLGARRSAGPRAGCGAGGRCCTLAQVQLLVMLNTWYQKFYDALQNSTRTRSGG